MKVLERACGHACGPYRWQAIDVETIAVRTNNLVCGAFRGFGANQAQFAMEGVLDRLAEQVGISAWEIRKRNVIRPGDTWGPGQIMDEGAGGAEVCLDEIRADYEAAIADGKAVGLGLGLKNSGLGNGFREVCGAVVRFRSDDRPRRGPPRLDRDGSGRAHRGSCRWRRRSSASTPDRIDVIVDTTRELGFGQTTGSRGTLMAAGSVREACQAALAAGLRARRRPLRRAHRRLDPPPRRPGAPEPDDPLVLLVRDADGGDRPRERPHRTRRRRARRRQGGQPGARRGPDRGQRAHGPRLRADARTSPPTRRPASRPT